MPLVLFKNARLVRGTGTDSGIEVVDIAVGGSTILAVEHGISAGTLGGEVIDLQGRVVIPGLVDGHVHFLGAAGDEGYSSKTPEVYLSHFVTAGVTTAVGCLGFGRGSEDLRHLYVKAQTLASEGLSTYIYTGSFQLPSPSITGSAAQDLVLLPYVLGVKVAIADAYSSQPTASELARLAGEAFVAGLQSGKPGLLHVHVGHQGDPFDLIRQVQKLSGVPKKQFILTHCNWSSSLVEGALEYARDGGFVDFSTVLSPKRGSVTSISAADALRRLMEGGVPIAQVTFSSDGNVGMPMRNADGTQRGLYLERMESLWEEIKSLVKDGLPLGQVIRVATENPARRLGLYPRKGAVEAGSDADMIVLNDDLSIQAVYLGGKPAVRNGKPVLFSRFESVD